MKATNGCRCCFVGAILASLTWAVIFFLYAHIDSSDFDVPSRAVRFVPRHDVVWQNDDLHTSTVQATPLDRRLNRPSYIKFGNKQSHIFGNRQSHGESFEGITSEYSSNELVHEGIHLDPADASKIVTDTDQEIYNHGIRAHAFNAFLSDRLSFHRHVQDTRDERCPSLAYDLLPSAKVSIVMCFYNEALSVLLRSLTSIFDRTPHTLIQEVILVDDDSNDVNLKRKLDKYVATKFGPKVVIVRNKKREGLIRSRMIGANSASAQVLVFLDSHIEVNVGWLEPLLSRLAANKHTVVLPIIDIINSDTFEYKGSPLVRGGVTWAMRFSWDEIPSSILKEKPFYISSPTMAGGLLAITREFYFHLGGYDSGMDIWGGENIEMSLRVWMCGGQIDIAVCSRVGHIFRKVRPYSSPTGEDTMTRNTLRLVNVWLDEHKERFFEAVDNRYTNVKYGDVRDREALRTRLNCESFEWYLKNVYNPDFKMKTQFVQKVDVAKKRASTLNIINKGKLKLINSDYCIVPAPSDKVVARSPLVLVMCSSTHVKWYELEGGGFLIDKNKCLDVVSSAATVTKCTAQGGTQQWLIRDKQTSGYGALFNPGTGLCLSVPTSELGTRVDMSTCDKGSMFKYMKKS